MGRANVFADWNQQLLVRCFSAAEQDHAFTGEHLRPLQRSGPGTGHLLVEVGSYFPYCKDHDHDDHDHDDHYHNNNVSMMMIRWS